MKNNLLGLLLLTVISAFAIYAYNFPPNAKEPATPVSKNEISMNYSNEQMSTLDTQLIQNMMDNYRGNQLQTINSNLEMNDAQSVSFDIETLKKFLYHIENETKKNNNAITNNQLGVRMHYAAYPNDEVMRRNKELNGVNPKFQKHHTIVMIPTIEVKGVMVDFNPLDVNTYTNGLLINQPSTKTTIQKAASTVYGLTAALNHGTLSPPSNIN